MEKEFKFMDLMPVIVTFYDKGDTLFPSELDEFVTSLIVDKDMILDAQDTPDYSEMGFIRVLKMEIADVADSLENFPCSARVISDLRHVVLKPFVKIDFQPSYGSNGAHSLIREDFDAVGVFNSMRGYVAEFIDYARTLRRTKGASATEYSNPESVSFLTLWRGWAHQCWEGDWDAGIDFVGVVRMEDTAKIAFELPVEAVTVQDVPIV